MRLSATERIIRQAEEEDASPASRRNRDSGRVTDPLTTTVTSRDSAGTQGWPQAFEVDIDGLGLDDEEDKTLVNAEKVQAALLELRSYDTSPRRPASGIATPGPAQTPAAQRPEHRPGMGPVRGAVVRPVIGPVVHPHPGPAISQAPKAPAAVMTVSASRHPTLQGSSGGSPGRLDVGMLLLDTPAAAETRFELPAPLPEGGTPEDVLRPRHTVGRPLGILIAAATTAVVALVFGAWTTRSGHLAIGDGTRGSPAAAAAGPRSARAPHVPITAVIVPARPEAPTPEIAPALPAPLPSPPLLAALSPTPAASPPPSPVSAAPVSPTAHPSDADPASSGSGSASAGAKNGRTSAANDRPRPSRKVTSHKSRRHKTHAAKVRPSRPRPNRAVEVANPPTIRPPGDTHRSADPDNTLPFSE